jgi:hypothetical protein
MKAVKVEEVNYLVTADANGVISVWDFLDFLEKVHSQPEQYPLLGLEAESTVKISQRITAIEVIPLLIKYEEEAKPKEVENEGKAKSKQKKSEEKTKQIQKS